MQGNEHPSVQMLLLALRHTTHRILAARVGLLPSAAQLASEPALDPGCQQQSPRSPPLMVVCGRHLPLAPSPPCPVLGCPPCVQGTHGPSEGGGEAGGSQEVRLREEEPCSGPAAGERDRPAGVSSTDLHQEPR